MVNPQLVLGEHGLFGGHESEDIQTILFIMFGLNFKQYFAEILSALGQQIADCSLECGDLTF